MNISENVKQVFENIAAAASKAGRRADEITLVAASKTNSAQRIREAAAAGITIFGENRVQEMLEKNALGAYSGCALHFIGHLQKNKAKSVVGLAGLIHSVDSEGLMALIGSLAEKRGAVQDVLLEVNIGAEPSKSGFSEREIPEALGKAAEIRGIFVRGLMAVPPVCTEPEQNRSYFDRMEHLFVDNSSKKYDNVSMDFLSMGMSGDYCAAIECGSNMIRIGTGIFGPRDYS